MPRLRVALLLLWLIALAPYVGLLGGQSQTVSLDPSPDSAYWLDNAPQERSSPLRNGYVDVNIMRDGGPVMLWETGGFEPIFAGAVMDTKNAYVVDNSGNVSALNLTTGRLVWSTQLSGATVTATPALAYGWLYVATESKKLFALSPQTGSQILEATLKGAAIAPPLAADGRIYQGTDAGYLEVFEGSTLDKVWEFDTATTAFDTVNGTVDTSDTALRKAIRAAPSFYESRVYFSAWNGKMYSLSATSNVQGNPTMHWQSSLGGTQLNAPGAIDHRNDRIIAATGDGKLVALTLSGGTSSWTLTVGEAFSGGAAVSKDHVAAGTTDGRLVVTNTAGTLKWDRLEPEGLIASPVLTKDALVMLTARGKLELLDAANGTTLKTQLGNAEWRMRDGSHADPAVTEKGVLVTDLAGYVTFIGPRPDNDADLRASDLTVDGALNPAVPLSVSARVRNLGPDPTFDTTARFILDDEAFSTTELGGLDPDAEATWTIEIPDGLALGTHTLDVRFEPIGATDPDPVSAIATLKIEITEPVNTTADTQNGTALPPGYTIGADGFPRDPDGNIDMELYFVLEAETANGDTGTGGDATNATDLGPAGFVDGFSGQMGIWMLPAFLVAAGGGAYLGIRFVKGGKDGGAPGAEGSAEADEAGTGDADDTAAD